MQKEVKRAPVPLKVPGRLGVKGRMTFWKNHSVRLGVMKKTPAAMKIMPTLTLATQRGDEDDENNDGFGDVINSSQIDPRATENEGND